jgi:hypothetical protein
LKAARGVVLKSIHGMPFPIYPRGIDLAHEARTARRRFYPVTVLYTAYAAAVVGLGLRTRPWTTVGSVGLGAASGTPSSGRASPAGTAGS